MLNSAKMNPVPKIIHTQNESDPFTYYYYYHRLFSRMSFDNTKIKTEKWGSKKISDENKV